MDITQTQGAPQGTLDFLSFQLGGLEYGVDFRKVKELRTLKSLERFAADGEIVEGVAVSRGVIMPIVDMRVAFGDQAFTPAQTTDVIILQLASCVMGMVVDGVTDVVRLEAAQITPMPGIEGGSGCDYLTGLGKSGTRRLILVDIDKLMSIQREPGMQKAA